MDFPDFRKANFVRAREIAERRYGKPIAEGRHRIVFRDKDHVVKVPTQHSGISACFEELTIQGDIYAKTEYDQISQEIGMPAVRMEWVEHRGFSEEPDWTWTIDCGQVGHTNDGRLVAYDWERF